MVKKGLTILLIGMLISGVGLFSGCRRHSHSHKAEFMVDYISETLDLNENQQEQLDQIKDELLTKAKDMHADKASMHEELVVQLRSEEIDQVRVKNLIAEHRAKMDEIVDLVVTRLSEFHQTLTPEQKEKLVAKIETFKKWHHRGMD
jgi:Spy/CpxP family protein refolding chaperone